MDIKVGTSGWNFYDKDNSFYPKDLKTKEKLSFYSKTFNTVEINSTFYHFARESTIDKWISETEEDFKFIIKINKYFTHIKKLIIDEESIQKLEDFLTSLEALKHKLGGILIQIPPSFKINLHVLDLFLKETMKIKKENYKIFLEIRDDSWLVDGFFKLLNFHDVNLVYNDTNNKWPNILKLTGDTLYLRLHGREKLYYSNYSKEDLEEIILKLDDIKSSSYIFFNNTTGQHGIENALLIKKMIIE